MAKTFCPDCDAAIIVDDPVEGATITCNECGTELEIISTDPFEVDFSLDYEEDWDDDDEE
jgi:alpha-aminoadipate carrier protein LysW